MNLEKAFKIVTSDFGPQGAFVGNGAKPKTQEPNR